MSIKVYKRLKMVKKAKKTKNADEVQNAVLQRRELGRHCDGRGRRRVLHVAHGVDPWLTGHKPRV